MGQRLKTWVTRRKEMGEIGAWFDSRRRDFFSGIKLTSNWFFCNFSCRCDAYLWLLLVSVFFYFFFFCFFFFFFFLLLLVMDIYLLPAVVMLSSFVAGNIPFFTVVITWFAKTIKHMPNLRRNIVRIAHECNETPRAVFNPNSVNPPPFKSTEF